MQKESLLKVISLGTLNFTNCLPVNYPLDKWGSEKISLSYGYPTLINQLIEEEQVQVAVISAIEYIKNAERYSLIDSICISSDDEVGSVILFSNYELKDLNDKKIGVPYTSSTSIALLKILLQESHVDLNNVIFIKHKYEQSLDEFLQDKFDAVLYIGDPALIANINNNGNYIKYDLGREWKMSTGYPMVFATWVALSEWKIANLEDFEWLSFMLDKSVDAGLNMYFNEVVSKAIQKLSLDEYHVKDYFINKINYKFEPQHLESIQLFEKLYGRLKE